MAEVEEHPTIKSKGRRRKRPGRLKDSVFWADTKMRIGEGKITPIIGNSITNSHIFHKRYGEIIEDWAKEIGYPGSNKRNLVRVSQFFRMKEDPFAARNIYLELLKEILLEIAEVEGVSQKRINDVEENFDQLSFSDMAQDLGYLNFKAQSDHPLMVLANLPLPIYITTSYHQFLEMALVQAGKEPRSEIYYWRRDLENDVPSFFTENPNFDPTVSQPLVYHLYGRDDYPDSLVLTENDYLDFLANVLQDLSRHRVSHNVQDLPSLQGLPSLVEATLTQSSLLLLGYELEDWDFRVLFRGLIVVKTEARLREGITIQFYENEHHDREAANRYLENYFRQASKLKIYWGDPQSCLLELQKIWRGE